MAITIDEPHQSREDLIRQRAYELYVQRLADGRPGDAESAWHIAEQELTDEGEIVSG